MIEVICLALRKLKEQDQVPEEEPELNRMFFRILRHEALVEWERENDIEVLSTPMAEAQNQASPDDEDMMPREHKRPDGKWSYRNSRNPVRGERSVVEYDIECKRLREPSESNHKFNKEYVKEGIIRFIREESGYGEGVSSSVMIGYVQGMDMDKILNEVNNSLSSFSIDNIKRCNDCWYNSKPNKLNQPIEGREIHPEDFTLRHLWIDLRSLYTN